MPKQVLFKSNEIVIVLQEAPGATLFVTFNGMGEVASGDKFWGDAFFFKKDIPAVGVMTTRPNWLPNSQLHLIAETILSICNGRRVITYGHSQGGYSAIKMSKALNAQAAIAFCPQFSINPKDVGDFDKRYVSYYGGNNGEAIKSTEICQNSYIFFDPYEPRDAKNASLIAALAPKTVKSITAPFSSHSTILLFSESKLSSDLINMFCAEELPTAHACRGLVRRTRARSTTYQTEKVKALLKRINKGEIFLKRSIEQVPQNQRPAFELMYLVEKKDHEAAKSKLNEVENRFLISPEPLTYWTYFRQTGFLEGELKVAQILNEKFAENEYIRMHVANTYIQANDFVRAEPLVVKLAGSKSIGKYIGHISAFARKLRRADLLDLALQNATSSGQISEETKLALSMAVCEIYSSTGNRALAINKINSLTIEYSESHPVLKRISDLAMRLGFSQVALTIRDQCLVLDPTNEQSRLDVIEATIATDPPTAFQELSAILNSNNSQSSTYWDRVAALFERLGDSNGAINAANRSLTINNDSSSSRLTLASAHLNNGNSKQALSEISQLSISSTVSGEQLERAVDIAFRLREGKLALVLARKLISISSSSHSSQLALSEALVSCAEFDEALSILKALSAAVNAGEHFRESELIRLCRLLPKVQCFDIQRKVLAIAIQLFPKSRQLQDINRTSAFIEQFSSESLASSKGALKSDVNESNVSNFKVRLSRLFKMS